MINIYLKFDFSIVKEIENIINLDIFLHFKHLQYSEFDNALSRQE